MVAEIVVELPGGNKIFFGEVAGQAGLVEAARMEDIAHETADKLKAALGSLGELVGMLQESIARMPKRPDRIEMSFGASLSGKCDLRVVSGQGEAEFKVTLGWGAGA